MYLRTCIVIYVSRHSFEAWAMKEIVGRFPVLFVTVVDQNLMFSRSSGLLNGLSTEFYLSRSGPFPFDCAMVCYAVTIMS